ncbi:unnamed protein product [Cunninghamella echinulata]
MAIVTENTPLLDNNNNNNNNDVRPRRFSLPPTEEQETNDIETPPRKNPFKAYLYIFGSLLFLILFIASFRSTLPRPYSLVEAGDDEFSGIHSYNEYLSHFKQPHSANQYHNTDIYEWIIKQVKNMAETAKENNINVDLITNDTVNLVTQRDKYSEGEYWYIESRNVFARVHGKSGSLDNALLINAHYDSVSTADGVTDNGMGVATALELLYYYVHHPPQHTMIFLFNNFEEGGLLGAKSFVNHPWFNTFQLFLNLEGTGSGGRCLLFRSSHLEAVKKLASSNAHYLHASPFGNDLLKSRLIRSDTDYTTFTGHGKQGLDIAYYTPRSHYHTQRDDLAHTTPSSLQYMGQMALGFVREVDASDNILTPSTKPVEKFIYFDILGRWMLAYSFSTNQLINIFVLVSTPIISLIWLGLKSRHVEGSKRQFWLHAFIHYLQGCFSVLMALVFIVGLDTLAIYALLKLKPLVTYGNAYLVVLYLTFASLFGLTLSQLLLTRIKRLHRSYIDLKTTLIGLSSLWYIGVVGATVLAADEIAGGYFAIYFLMSSLIAIDLSYLLQRYPKFQLPIVFIVQLVVPIILMVEFCFLSVDALRFVTADGTPESSVYISMVTPIILITLLLLPWIHISGDKRQPACVFFIFFILFFAVCLVVSPFNRIDSPNRIVFHLEYNETQPTATVELVTGHGLQSTLETYLPKDELSTLTCTDTDNGYQESCKYETKDLPLHATSKNEYNLKVIDNNNDSNNGVDGEYRRFRIITTVQHSQLCQLKFTLPVLYANVNGEDIIPTEDHPMYAIMVYTKTIGQPVTWDVELQEKDLKVYGVQHAVQLSCLYDDWVDGELPAYTHLRNRLPETQALTIRGGVGLSVVHYTSTSLP